jgi:hypothetical protein
MDLAAVPEVPPPHPQAASRSKSINPYPSFFIFPPNFVSRKYLQKECEANVSVSLRFG